MTQQETPNTNTSFKHSITGDSYLLQQRISLFAAGKQDVLYFNDEENVLSAEDITVNIFVNNAWRATAQIFGGRRGASFGYKTEENDSILKGVFEGEPALGGFDVYLS
jgi:hypothetical protein